MSFYPATMHAYNAGFDDGFFDLKLTKVTRTKSEAKAYKRGYESGVKYRPKSLELPRVKVHK